MAINKKTYQVKGCPFCGRKPKLVPCIGCGCTPKKSKRYVACSKGMAHHIHIGGVDAADAVKNWNERSNDGEVMFTIKSIQ